MLRIGVNALYLIPGGVGGTEIYLRNLLQALAAIDAGESVCRVHESRDRAAIWFRTRPISRMRLRTVRASFRPARILWEQLLLPFAVRRHRLDVLFNPGFTAPMLCGCPMVTVFHDLQHKRHPEYFRWFDLPFWKFFLWAAARRSRGLIAVSNATRDDLKRFYGVERDNYLSWRGARSSSRSRRRREPKDYLLCVSTLHPHKNLERLLRVYQRSQDLPKLIVTGVRGFAARKIWKRCGRPRLSSPAGFRAKNFTSCTEARAGSFIRPRSKGFGMPVLEAMAAGVPLACSDIPVLREVAGDCRAVFRSARRGARCTSAWCG